MPTDDLDHKKLRLVRWTFAADPHDAERALEPRPAPNPDWAARRKQREEGERFESEFRAELARVLALPEPERAPAVKGLLKRVEKAGLAAAWLSSDPAGVIQLLRLLVAYRRHLGKPPVMLTFAVQWESLREQEGFEALLLELVRADDPQWLDTLSFLHDDELDDLHQSAPGLGAELAALLADPSSTPGMRQTALDLLRRGDWPAQADAVRPMLREEGTQLRSLALNALRNWDALTADDLCFLLQDLAERPLEPKDPMGVDGDFWEEVLLEGIAERRPPRGPELLEPFLDDRIRGAGGIYLGDGWALKTLAAAYPEQSLARVDARLDDWSGYDRQKGLDAVARLPREHALPRLARCANDPIPKLARSARDLHLELSGSPLPASPPLLLDLLDDAQRAALGAKLSIALQPEDEPRKLLLEKLWNDRAQATPGEALLLLFLFCDGHLVYSTFEHGLRLPESVAELYPRGGTLLVRGVLALARRFPECSEVFQLARQLSESLTAEQRALAQAFVAELLADPDPRRDPDLGWVNLFGLPSQAWPHAYARMIASGWRAYFTALSELDAPELDLRIAEDLRAYRPGDAGSWAVLSLGVERQHAQALALAKQRVEQTTDPAEIHQLADPRLLGKLYASAGLDRAQLDAELDAPDSPRFLLGLRSHREESDSPRLKRALWAALTSAHLDSRARLGALLALVSVAKGQLRPSDPRVRTALSRLSAEDRVTFLGMLLVHQLPLKSWRPLILEGLLELPLDGLDSLPSFLATAPGGKALLKSAMLQCRDPARRAVLAEGCS